MRQGRNSQELDGLTVTSLIGGVFDNDIGLVILEIS